MSKTVKLENGHTITFDEDKHVYIHNNEYVVGMSTLLGKLASPALEAWKVNSTKVRIRWIGSLAGGGFTANTGGPATYQNFDVTPEWPSALGGSNDIGTVSFGTPAYNLADNGAVRFARQNMKLSDYYGTQNLGTDGG